MHRRVEPQELQHASLVEFCSRSSQDSAKKRVKHAMQSDLKTFSDFSSVSRKLLAEPKILPGFSEIERSALVGIPFS